MVVRQFLSKIAIAVLICVLWMTDYTKRLLGFRDVPIWSLQNNSSRDDSENGRFRGTQQFEASEDDMVTVEWVDVESAVTEDTGGDLLTVTELSEDPFSESQPMVDASRPLPTIEIHRPTADRGADDVREHLDGKRCVFCNVPVGNDEEFIETDMFGMLVVKPICKGHSEHPDSWLRARQHVPEKMGYCPSCGDVTLQGPCLDA